MRLRKPRLSRRIGVFTRLAATGAVCLAAAPGLSAAPVIDQSYVVPTNQFRGGIPVTGGQTAAQSLTVGVEGILSRVDLQVGGLASYPLVLEIGRGTNPGTDTLLASFGFTAPQWSSVGVYAITSIDVATALINVDPGDQLVLSLSTTSNIFGGWALGMPAFDGVYAGGQAYGNGFPQGGDLAFRIWVDPVTTVPEPASGALMLLGLVIATGLQRRRGCKAWNERSYVRPGQGRTT